MQVAVESDHLVLVLLLSPWGRAASDYFLPRLSSWSEPVISPI